MSIWTYTSLEYAEKDADSVTAHAVDHREGCTVGKTGWPDVSRKELGPECEAAGCRVGYRVETYRGKVLALRERNGYDDSDFEARVVRADGTVGWTVYATTRGWTYFNGAEIDAPQELREKVAADDRARENAWAEKCAAEKAELDAKTPGRGDLVRVKSARSKIPQGTEGVVVWFGVSQYARNYGAGCRHHMLEVVNPNHDHPGHRLKDYRVGIKVEGQEKPLFASATVVEILEKATPAIAS